MPNNKNESTMQWKVDIAQFKKNIVDAKRQISLANAEFKTATAGMDKWSKSTTGVEEKLKALNKTLPAQKKILDELNKQYELTVKEQGANSKEAEKLKLQIENQKGAIAKTEAQISKYTSDLSKLQSEEKKANSESGKLTATIQKQEKEVSELKDEYKNAVLQYGKNSKEAKALAKQIETLSADLNDNKKKQEAADKAADDLDKSLKDEKTAAKDASEGFTVMKGALADLVASGIKAAVGALKDLANAAKDAYAEFDAGRDTVIKLTGATGEAAAEMTESFKTVAKSVKGDMTTIGNAVGEVNTRFGLTGADLEKLSTQFVKFAEINGVDVKTSIDDVQKALSAYGLGASETEGFLDRLTKTGQETGVSVGSLTSGIISNATAFQELGLSADQAVVLMGQLEKSGANSETVLNGMRKALKNAAKEGKPLDRALTDLQTTIQFGSEGMDGLNAAYELFGKSGDQIYGAIQNGTISFRNLAGAVSDASGTVENTYGQTVDGFDAIGLAIQGAKTDLGEYVGSLLEEYEPDIQAFINKAIPAFEKFFKSVVDGIGKAAPYIEGLFNFISTNKDLIIAALAGIAAGFVAFRIAGLITALVTAFQTFFGVIKAGQGVMAALNAVMAANPIGLIVAAIAGLVAAFVVLWNKSEAFRNFWIKTWETIKAVALAAWEGIKKAWNGAKAFFSGVWNGIKNVFATVGSFFREKFTAAYNGIKNAFAAIGTFFSGVWDRIKAPFVKIGGWFKERFVEAWNNIKYIFSAKSVGEFFGNIWNVIKERFTNIGQKVGEAIGSAFKLAINSILATVENVLNTPINAINNLLDIINKVPGINLSKLTPFSLPRLASGGVLNSARAIIAGEDGAEAIVPLDKNTEWISKIVQGVLSALNVSAVKTSVGASRIAGIGVSGGYGGGITNSKQIIFNQYNNSPKALDALTIYRDTNKLLFSAKVKANNV